MCLVVLLAFIAGCSGSSNVRHYELMGGDPKIDYIDFLNDSLCEYIVPGPLTLTSKYRKDGDYYTIYINDYIKAQLKVVDETTLKGEPPFFDGLWVKK